MNINIKFLKRIESWCIFKYNEKQINKKSLTLKRRSKKAFLYGFTPSEVGVTDVSLAITAMATGRRELGTLIIRA